MSIAEMLRWPWSPWVDVLTFSYGGSAYLLQGRRNKISGRSHFAVRSMAQWYRVMQPHDITIDELKRAGLWSQPEPQTP